MKPPTFQPKHSTLNPQPAGHPRNANKSAGRKEQFHPYLFHCFNASAVLSISPSSPAALASIRETGKADAAQLRKACEQIALVQYLDTLLEFGDQIARDSLKRNPGKMIILINALCTMSNSALALEKHQARVESKPADETPSEPDHFRR